MYEMAIIEYEDSSNWWVCMPNTLENVLQEIKQHADEDDLQHYFTKVTIERTGNGEYLAMGYTKDKEED